MQLLIQLIYFISLGIFLFTIPGILFLEKSQAKLSFWEKLILGSILGWIVFTFIGYIFLVLNLKYFILVVYFLILFLFFKNRLLSKFKIPLLPKKLLGFFIPVFIAGIILQLLIISPSGLTINGDILFWSSHAHDASWHIGIMTQMERGWPIQNPAFAGERLVNYHFFSDIAPMYFNYIFKIPYLMLYFQLMPFFYAIVFGSLSYLLGRKITGSFWGGFWSFIFADFAGSFGFVVTFLRDKTIGGENIFWSSMPQSTIGNPPQISALIIMFAFLYFFSIYLEKRTNLTFIFLVLLGGIMIVFKVYGGVALLGSISICAIWQLIKERRFEFTLMFFLSAVLSFVLFFPNTAQSQSLLLFEPWWYIRTIVVAPDRLGKIEWELRRQTYISEGNYKRVVQLELQAFLIFFFGNLGMRFLGLAIIPKYLKTFFSSYLNQLIFSVGLISFLFPMLFIQRGNATGTSQFFQYYLLIFGLLAAEGILLISRRIKSKLIKISFAILIVIIAIPTQIGLLTNFYHRSAFAKIDSNEQQALSFLKTQTPSSSVILTPLFNKYINLKLATPPIWGWSDSVYVGAFGERAIYLADVEQVDNTGYKYQDRKDLEEKLFSTEDPLTFNELIKESGAHYLYFPIKQKPSVNLNKTFLKSIFSNDEIQIWKI